MESVVNNTMKREEDINQMAHFFDALLESALANGFIDKKGKVSLSKGEK